MGSGQSRNFSYDPNNPYGQPYPPPHSHAQYYGTSKSKRRARGYSETMPPYPQYGYGAPLPPLPGYGGGPPPGYGGGPPPHPMFAPQPYPAPYGYGQPYGRPSSPNRMPYEPPPNPLPRRVTNVYASEKWRHLKRGASFTATRTTPTMTMRMPPTMTNDIPPPRSDDANEAIANASMNAPSMPFLAATNSTAASPLPPPPRTPEPRTPADVPLPETPMTERSAATSFGTPMHAWALGAGATPGPSRAYIPGATPTSSRGGSAYIPGATPGPGLGSGGSMLLAGPPISFDPKSHAFSLTSPHKVLHKKKIYRTAAHLFYAQMFFNCRPDVADEIRALEDATAARFTARRHDADKRPDWDVIWQDKIDETLYAKFTQHADLRAQLLETDARLLVNGDSTDALWGVGNDGTGKNELGKALMRVRDRLLRECGGTP